MSCAPKIACFALLCASLRAQTVCPPTPAYSICELAFPGIAANTELRAEFRSPSHRTYLIPGFWDGNKMLIRVSPTEAGTWDYRLTGSVENLNGKEGQFTATTSDSPGFITTANVHHFRYTATLKAHLWMGDTVPQSASNQYIDTRAAQKFNHLRVLIVPGPGKPDEQYYQALDARLLYINKKGITADLVIAAGDNLLVKLYPEREDRERFIRYLVARYGAMNITWQGLDNFETYDRGRDLMKEIASYISAADQYHHIQSTGTLESSGALYDDGWMKYLTYRATGGDAPAVEHQIYPAPGIVSFSGSDFRKQLWNAAMDGQYPEASVPDEEAANQMKVWFDFFSGTRHWELEPFFDVEGGRGLALEDVEYIIYVEKPGPVTVQVEKHSYDVAWINPINGERTELKNLKQETFTGEPPDRLHDWVLHISREGHKSGMLKSYKFESHEVLMQEVESNPDKVPFEIVQPAADTLSLTNPGTFAVKLKRDIKATRSMRYEWTGEVTADGQGYRVIGSGASGTLRIPRNIAERFPASLHLRVTAMNAYGKVFVSDRNYQLTQ